LSGVSTEQSTREQVAAVAEERFEHYQAWMHEQLLTDELTDQSERLAAPMENTFHYVLSPEGLAIQLSEETDDGTVTRQEPVRAILANGLRKAELQVALHPEWHFELERRRIELEEWDQIEALARGTTPSQTLMVFSPHPDAVRDGTTYIDGYNRERQKTMIRTITRTEDGVQITSTSLDQTNYQALAASVAAIGYELPAGKSSEEILAQRYWIDELPPEGFTWADVARRAYDLSLGEQLGGEWYAGRRPMDTANALAFIREQHDLIEQHMRMVEDVMTSVHDRRERASKLAEHRYNFAAALDARLHGELGEIDVAEAGDAARAEGLSFEGDCPTLQFPEEVLALQGYKSEVLCTCPFCFKQVWIDPCASNLICSACAAEVRDGKVVNYGRTRQRQQRQALGKETIQASLASRRSKTRSRIAVGAIQALANGERVRLEEHIGVGSAKRHWRHTQSGKIVEIKPEPSARAA